MENGIYRTRIRGGFMKMCLTPFVAAPGAWGIAGRSAAGAVLLAVTVSACTAGGSSVPSTFTPTPVINGHTSSQAGTRTPSPAGGSSRSASASTSRGGASASGSAHAQSSSHAATQQPTPGVTTVLPTHHASAPAHTSAPAFPTAAPETGGGGTAGLQDGLLFGAGGLAVLVGLGTFAYRRRLARKFGIHEPARRSPADREPVDR
jgi:hypothetical protein